MASNKPNDSDQFFMFALYINKVIDINQITLLGLPFISTHKVTSTGACVDFQPSFAG